MNKIESQKSDYPSMQGYMEQEEIKKMATCPSTHDEHDLYAAAHCLVSERVDKFDLIDMVYAILKREHSEKSRHTLHVLEWTDEPPKVPGWYWFKDEYGIRIAWIKHDSRKINELYAVIGGVGNWMSTLHGQWAGPIPEPQEPKKRVAIKDSEESCPKN